MRFFIVFLRIIAIIGILVGVDFIIQHWPYGKLILFISFILLGCSFIVKNKKAKVN